MASAYRFHGQTLELGNLFNCSLAQSGTQDEVGAGEVVEAGVLGGLPVEVVEHGRGRSGTSGGVHHERGDVGVLGVWVVGEAEGLGVQADDVFEQEPVQGIRSGVPVSPTARSSRAASTRRRPVTARRAPAVAMLPVRALGSWGIAGSPPRKKRAYAPSMSPTAPENPRHNAARTTALTAIVGTAGGGRSSMRRARPFRSGPKVIDSYRARNKGLLPRPRRHRAPLTLAPRNPLGPPFAGCRSRPGRAGHPQP